MRFLDLSLQPPKGKIQPPTCLVTEIPCSSLRLEGGIETIRKLFPNWHSEVTIHQSSEPQRRSHDPRREIVAHGEGNRPINMAIMCCLRATITMTSSENCSLPTASTNDKICDNVGNTISS